MCRDNLSGLLAILTLITVLLVSGSVLAASEAQIDSAVSINLTSIIMNGLIRIAAIGAGVYIVWLGHNTLIRGVKGEFEFEGQFGKLKGSAPGLLFVLLGTLAIGWALQTTASGSFDIDESASQENSSPTKHTLSGSSIPPPDGNSSDGASDSRPDFLPATGENTK